MDALANRGRLYAECGRDFGRRKLLQVPEHERLAVQVWKAGQRGARVPGECRLVQAFLGPHRYLQRGGDVFMPAV